MSIDLTTVAPDVLEAVKNNEQIKVLSIFRYVQGAMLAFFSLYPIIYMVIGFVLMFSPEALDDGMSSADAAAGGVVGGVIVIISVAVLLVLLIMCVGSILAAIYMPKRKHYWLCFTVSCIECLFFPYGTAMGVLSIIVLVRQSVKAEFAAAPKVTGA